MNGSTNKAGRFTRMCWWIAGATPDILIKYPSEYSKFTAIGMTIGMTCLVAVLSGIAAAWYFSQSLPVSFCFGLFWGVVIFCIDRALVVTMKKSIDTEGWWPQLKEALKILVPRALLAFLVAMLMSIPLELIVFEDLINQERENYFEDKKEQASNVGYTAGVRMDAEADMERNTRQQERADREVARSETAESAALREVERIEREISVRRGQLNNPATSRYRNAVAEKGRLQRQNNDRNADTRNIAGAISRQDNIIREEKNTWNAKVNGEISKLQTELASARRVYEEKKGETAAAKAEQKEIGAEGRDISRRKMNAASTIDKANEERDKIYRNSNKFLLNYGILQYAVNARMKIKEKVEKPGPTSAPVLKDTLKTSPSGVMAAEEAEPQWREREVYRNKSELVMLWFIRILFFIFEMMPTVVKAVSKPGPYERECEAQDMQIARFLNSQAYTDHVQTLLSERLRQENDLAESRRKAEKDLHEELLQEIKGAQKEVAHAAISRWRAEQLGARVAASAASAASAGATSSADASTVRNRAAGEDEDDVFPLSSDEFD